MNPFDMHDMTLVEVCRNYPEQAAMLIQKFALKQSAAKLPSKDDFMFFRAGFDVVSITDAEKIYDWFVERMKELNQ